jgi:hypothetical protein
MFCPKCGQPLQDDWVACPKCGDKLKESPPAAASSTPPDKKHGLALILTAMLTIALVGGFLIFMNSVGGPSSRQIETVQPSKPQKAIVLAAVDESQIVIINGNDFAWISPELILDVGNVSYSYKHPAIPAKGKVLLDLSNFVNGKGEKFNGYMLLPDSIRVLTGNASGEMKFKQ